MNAHLPNGLSQRLTTQLRTWCCACLLASYTSSVWAATEFTIQVGAFKNPSDAFANQVREYGEVNTAQRDNNITLFTVGRYDSVDSAKQELDRIRGAFPGAFIRNMPAAARRSQASTPRETAVANETDSAIPDAQIWESLSAAERSRVVYLDGVLHLKQGDQFVPLAEYRRSQ